MSGHTVEKIGGTTMSRADELVGTLFAPKDGDHDLYKRIFVVSAFGGVTDLLLENKKTGEPGVYGEFAASDHSMAWNGALDRAANSMGEAHAQLLQDSADQRDADDFLRERIEGARSVLIDLQRLASYGHFRLDEQMTTIRELLSGIGEAHSARVLALLLRRHGVNASMVDLTGWRDESHPILDERIGRALDDVDLTSEMPIVTGYAQCSEGLVRLYDRGYSEVTFARIAAHTGAREAVIHKEFHLSSADPRIVGKDKVVKIGRTNYDVADQLSNLGMEAVHPSAAKILRQADIPLRVANAFEPQDRGTLIAPTGEAAPRVEMITGLDVVSLEVFEQDMVGVKGYDATILASLTRHEVRIVSKTSNANTITHYVDASLNSLNRVERQITETYPMAEISIRRVALISAVGACLAGLEVPRRGLEALSEAGIEPLGVQSAGRQVDVQFVVSQESMEDAVRALHGALVEGQT